MKRNFTVPLHSVSINNFYYANKRHGIKAEAREWQSKFFHYLSLEPNKQALADLRSTFNEQINGYIVKLAFGIPKQDFLNKGGTLSSRAIDLTNCEKSVIDVLFLPKHFDTEPPYGCQNLCLDDKYLLEMTSRKYVADKYEINIQIEIVDRKERCGA